jgi:hypothetical protein
MIALLTLLEIPFFPVFKVPSAYSQTQPSPWQCGLAWLKPCVSCLPESGHAVTLALKWLSCSQHSQLCAPAGCSQSSQNIKMDCKKLKLVLQLDPSGNAVVVDAESPSAVPAAIQVSHSHVTPPNSRRDWRLPAWNSNRPHHMHDTWLHCVRCVQKAHILAVLFDKK